MGRLRSLLKTVVQETARTLLDRSSGSPDAPAPAPAPARTPTPTPARMPAPTPARMPAPETTPRPASGDPALVDLPALQAACRPNGKPRILHHWATWCEPCEEELPLIASLHARLEDRAELLAISWDLLDPHEPPAQAVESVRQFLNARGCQCEFVLFQGEAEALFEGLRLDFQRIPQTRVVDAEGRTLLQWDGPLDEAAVTTVLNAISRP